MDGPVSGRPPTPAGPLAIPRASRTAATSPFAPQGGLSAPDGLDIPELCRLGASELIARMRSGALSSRTVVTAFLDYIDRVNPSYNAIVSLRPRANVLADADAADRMRQAGDPLGALHGLPIAIKDLAGTRGLRTTYGSPLFADFVPEEDELVVARIRAAGAIVVGKTNTPEFGLGSQSYNTVFGVTLNAFDKRLCAGGSSGGAAAALALRLLPLADGSDMGGSLRNPAGFNNVYGLRPGQGRIPDPDSPDLFYTQLATAGPMARSAADLALLLDVMAGPDPRDPLALAAAERFLNRSPSSGRAAPFVIAWLGDLDGHLPFEAGVLDVCQAALARLEAAGCRIEPATVDFDWEALWRTFVVLRQFSIVERFRPLYDDTVKRNLMKPELVWEIEAGRRLAVGDVALAAHVRTCWFRTALSLFKRFDGLALPSAQVFAFPADIHWPSAIAGRDMDSYHRWMEVVAPGTLSGCPVIGLPAGFDGRGRSMGLQVIGRPRAERSLLDLAELYETQGAVTSPAGPVA